MLVARWIRALPVDECGLHGVHCRWFKHGFDRVKEASENTLAIVVNKMLPSIEWAVIQVPTKYTDKGSKL